MKQIAFVPLLTFLVLILSLVAKTYHERWGGNAQQSCPSMDSMHYMHAGLSASKGERCGYLEGALPRCVNSQLNLPLVDEDDRELACQNFVCVEKKGEKKDCGTKVLGWTENGPANMTRALPDVCESGVCIKDKEGNFNCQEERVVQRDNHCTQNRDCKAEDYCFQGNSTCQPRILNDQTCHTVDLAQKILPNDMSYECEQGHFCVKSHDWQKCKPLKYGLAHTGTACPWNNTLGDARPQCALGRAFCNEAGICRSLVGEGGECMFNTNAGFEDAVQQCTYGHGCHPLTNPNETDAAWVKGKCVPTRGFKAGETSFLEEFCEYGLFLHTDTYVCSEPLKTMQTCAKDSECDSSADTGKLTCQCTRALTRGAPGQCKKDALTSPAMPYIKYDSSCHVQFRNVATYLEQFYKKVEHSEDGREEYNKEAHELARKGLCCMRRTVREESHMYYISGLFLIDFFDAGVHCNQDLIWLWIVIGTLVVGSIFGVFVALNEAISGEAVTPSEENMPFGSEAENDDDGMDVVKELIKKTTLDEANMTSGKNSPMGHESPMGRAPGTSAH